MVLMLLMWVDICIYVYIYIYEYYLQWVRKFICFRRIEWSLAVYNETSSVYVHSHRARRR